MQRAWVVTDMQQGLSTPELVSLATTIAAAIDRDPAPVFALVQHNPTNGPLATLRAWQGCQGNTDDELLEPIAALAPVVFAKTGYGALTPLPIHELRDLDEVFLTGADTDACVLATAFVLFDAGVPIVVRADLCWSSAGTTAHHAALALMRRQFGSHRVRS